VKARLCIRWAFAFVAAAGVVRAGAPGPTDWPTYGHDIHHTFNGKTKLDALTVHTLLPKWYFHTGDAVTANPIVVGGKVYFGSWDGNFYAVDGETGQQIWVRALDPQPTVRPHSVAGNPLTTRQLLPPDPNDLTSDGGLVTGTAFFQPGEGSRPDLVIFGGGFTLYALDAATGDVFWKQAYTGLPEQPPDPTTDETRLFSSPVVVGDKILFGVTSDGQNGHRGYFVIANLADGSLVKRFETDVDASGAILNDGCGGVWSSPTVDETNHLVVFDVADCNFFGNVSGNPYNERVIALHFGDSDFADGSLAWTFTPPRLVAADPRCDFDFGATANLGVNKKGKTDFLGVGGKDGYYYRIDPRSGELVWQTRVVFGGFSGGFIATAAYDGNRVYGATALGDFGRFEGFGEPSLGCEMPGLNDDMTLRTTFNPQDLLIQEPSMHAFDKRDGHVAWQGILSQSFGPTTVAGGMTFVGTGITRQIQIRDAKTGLLVHVLPLLAPSDSGIVVAGDALYVGTGSSEQGLPDGVVKFTPFGQ